MKITLVQKTILQEGLTYMRAKKALRLASNNKKLREHLVFSIVGPGRDGKKDSWLHAENDQQSD